MEDDYIYIFFIFAIVSYSFFVPIYSDKAIFNCLSIYFPPKIFELPPNFFLLKTAKSATTRAAITTKKGFNFKLKDDQRSDY